MNHAWKRAELVGPELDLSANNSAQEIAIRYLWSLLQENYDIIEWLICYIVGDVRSWGSNPTGDDVSGFAYRLWHLVNSPTSVLGGSGTRVVVADNDSDVAFAALENRQLSADFAATDYHAFSSFPDYMANDPSTSQLATAYVGDDDQIGSSPPIYSDGMIVLWWPNKIWQALETSFSAKDASPASEKDWNRRCLDILAASYLLHELFHLARGSRIHDGRQDDGRDSSNCEDPTAYTPCTSKFAYRWQMSFLWAMYRRYGVNETSWQTSCCGDISFVERCSLDGEYPIIQIDDLWDTNAMPLVPIYAKFSC